MNDFLTVPDRSEHIGLCNFIKGIFGLIQNLTAHEPRLNLTSRRKKLRIF